uniref:Uncharacterized protein n=1 Tax=Anguilla anguilla TaxID=7936 RepID=A0A0E9RVM2_ANGAN
MPVPSLCSQPAELLSHCIGVEPFMCSKLKQTEGARLTTTVWSWGTRWVTSC